jgi:hypothetical protein
MIVQRIRIRLTGFRNPPRCYIPPARIAWGHNPLELQLYVARQRAKERKQRP